MKIGVEAIPPDQTKGTHAHCTDTRIRTTSSQRALASQHNVQFKARLTCTDTRKSTTSSQRALASQHNTRDSPTPRSHTQCPPYDLCSATSRNRFLSTFAALRMLPAAFRSVRPGTPRAPVASFFRGGPSSAPCLSGLWSRHRNTSQLLKRSLLPFSQPVLFGEKIGSTLGIFLMFLAHDAPTSSPRKKTRVYTCQLLGVGPLSFQVSFFSYGSDEGARVGCGGKATRP